MNRNFIVMGNGPSAIRYPFGTMVDEFETVCRCNNFLTQGFEASIGSKTDVWAVCDGNIRPRDQRDFRQILFCVPLLRHDHPETWDWQPARPYTLISRDVVEEVTNLVGQTDSLWPSTGLLAVAHFLRFTKVVVVHGFDHFAEDRHHYFRSKDRNWYHDAASERRYMSQLLWTGRVRTLQQEFEDSK